MKLLAAIVALPLMVSGCSRDEEPGHLVEYQIGMDSMEVLAPAAPTDPMVVKLTGIIGPDTRYSFDHAQVVETPGVFEITLFGVRDDDPERVFVPVLVEWHGRPFEKQPPHDASVRVIFHQPDGGTMEKLVELDFGPAGT